MKSISPGPASPILTRRPNRPLDQYLQPIHQPHSGIRTYTSRRRDAINDVLQDKLDNLFAPSLGRLGDRYGQFGESREVANQQLILDIQFRAEVLHISPITVIKLTSTRSEHLSSFLVKARNREAYFACFGVPSIESLCALSNTLLFISSHFLRDQKSLRFSRTTLFIRFNHRRQPL
jgi:hypothetical protein